MAVMFSTRLAGDRNAGRDRFVRPVQVVREAPQVTQSWEQPLTVNTALMGFFHHFCKGSVLARSRCRSTMSATRSGRRST